MRLELDESKSRAVNQKHGVSLREAQEIFDQVYVVDEVERCFDLRSGFTQRVRARTCNAS